MDKSVPKKDPMTMPAVLAFERAESCEVRESEEVDAGVLDVAAEVCVWGAVFCVEMVVRTSVDVGCGDGRQPQRRERSDGRMLDTDDEEKGEVYCIAIVVKDVVTVRLDEWRAPESMIFWRR